MEIYDIIRNHIEASEDMVQEYWEIGKELAEAIGERAEYGKQLLPFLSERLSGEFGKGYTVRNLRNMRQFYQCFPGKNALRAELAWTHYRTLIRIEEPTLREFYLNESADNEWTARELERQINAQYHEAQPVPQQPAAPSPATPPVMPPTSAPSHPRRIPPPPPRPSAITLVVRTLRNIKRGRC